MGGLGLLVTIVALLGGAIVLARLAIEQSAASDAFKFYAIGAAACGALGVFALGIGVLRLLYRHAWILLVIAALGGLYAYMDPASRPDLSPLITVPFEFVMYLITDN